MLLVAFLVLALHQAAADRITLPFNTGWRFHRGDDLPYNCSTPESAINFPIDLTNVQISGLSPGNGSDAISCRASCNCTCQVYNFHPQQGCWVGLLESLGPSNWNTYSSGWVGGGRLGPALPPPSGQSSLSPSSPLYDDSTTFQSVLVPHDFVIEQTPSYSPDTTDQQHGYLPLSRAWYRNTFYLPAEWEGSLVRLHFYGVYRSTTIFVDGQYMGFHLSGYTGFDVWLHNISSSSSSVFGLNHTISLYIDSLTFQEGWYFEGSGLVRDVEMIVVLSGSNVSNSYSENGKENIDTPSFSSVQGVSITPWGVFAPSEVDMTTIVAPLGPWGPQTGNASVYPRTDIANDGNTSVTYTVTQTVIDSTNNIIASITSSPAILAANSWVHIEQSLSLPQAQLWFPAANASSPLRPLYTLNTVVSVQVSSSSSTSAYSSTTVVADSLNTTFGIRNAIFDANEGLIINGFPVKVTGFSMHQDFGGSGIAVPQNLVKFRVQRLLELGSNAWRTAHNPPSQFLLNECDARGVLVWEENRFLRMFPEFVQDAADMVLQDRNHPSVIIWSLCNENGCLEAPGMEGALAPAVAGGAVAEMYKEAMYAADGTRPITANTHAEINQPGTILDALDVIGVTYDYSAYDTLHQARPWVPIIGGESASCVSDRGFSKDDNATTGEVGSYDPLGCTGPAWQAAAIRPWISGNFQWAGADYQGESYYPAVITHYGIIDLCGFSKPTSYWYKAWWGGERNGPNGQPLGDPTQLYAFPAWDGVGYAVNDPVRIVAFSSADILELQVNGVKVGGNITMTPFGYAEWDNVPYVPGSYTVTAYTTADDGQQHVVVASYTVTTPGAPAAVLLSLEWGGSGAGGALITDNVDVVLVTVTVVDANNNVVSSALSAHMNVTFEITSGSGMIYGVCNGNPADHTSAKANVKGLYGGVARVSVMGVVTTTGEAGQPVVLSASVPGLPTATLSIATAIV